MSSVEMRRHDVGCFRLHICIICVILCKPVIYFLYFSYRIICDFCRIKLAVRTICGISKKKNRLEILWRVSFSFLAARQARLSRKCPPWGSSPCCQMRVEGIPSAHQNSLGRGFCFPPLRSPVGIILYQTLPI